MEPVKVKELFTIVESLLSLGFPPQTVMALPEVSDKLEPLKAELFRLAQVHCHNTKQDCLTCPVNTVFGLNKTQGNCQAYNKLKQFYGGAKPRVGQDKTEYRYSSGISYYSP